MELLVNIDVDDIDRAINFYTLAFNLTVGRRLGDVGVELIGGSSAILLLAKPSGTEVSSAADQKRTYERHWTPVHLDFVVDDVEVGVDRALAAGAQLEESIETYEWGKLARMSDPFGHGICLVQFLGRGYDEIAG